MPTTHLCWTWRWRRCRCLYLKCWQSICVLSVKKMKQTVPTRCLTGLVAYHGVEAWCADDHWSCFFFEQQYKNENNTQHVTAKLEVWNEAKAWFGQQERRLGTSGTMQKASFQKSLAWHNCTAQLKVISITYSKSSDMSSVHLHLRRRVRLSTRLTQEKEKPCISNMPGRHLSIYLSFFLSMYLSIYLASYLSI